MTAAIKQSIKDHYRYRGGLLFFELRSGTGYALYEPQGIDAFHMEEIPSKMLKRTAYEIKVSRADFLAEIRKPWKRRFAMSVSNNFFFISLPRLIRPEEVPLGCGLIEVAEKVPDQGLSWDTIVPSPWRDTSPPTWPFVAALARAIKKLPESAEETL